MVVVRTVSKETDKIYIRDRETKSDLIVKETVLDCPPEYNLIKLVDDDNIWLFDQKKGGTIYRYYLVDGKYLFESVYVATEATINIVTKNRGQSTLFIVEGLKLIKYDFIQKKILAKISLVKDEENLAIFDDEISNPITKKRISKYEVTLSDLYVSSKYLVLQRIDYEDQFSWIYIYDLDLNEITDFHGKNILSFTNNGEYLLFFGMQMYSLELYHIPTDTFKSIPCDEGVNRRLVFVGDNSIVTYPYINKNFRRDLSQNLFLEWEKDNQVGRRTMFEYEFKHQIDFLVRNALMYQVITFEDVNIPYYIDDLEYQEWKEKEGSVFHTRDEDTNRRLFIEEQKLKPDSEKETEIVIKKESDYSDQLEIGYDRNFIVDMDDLKYVASYRPMFIKQNLKSKVLEIEIKEGYWYTIKN